MKPVDYFYIVPEDVFQLGNKADSRLSHIRPKDVDTIEINGITVVIANGMGISVFDSNDIRRVQMTGWVWKIPANTHMPTGLKLVQDKPGHYCIAPISNMPIDKYKGLLEELALSATRVFEKTGVRA